jgi:thiol:disulfide interchange protein DsbD
MKKLLVFAGLLLGFTSLSHATSIGISELFTSHNPETIASVMQQYGLSYYLVLFFGLGLLLAFTPCVLPMVPILSSVIAQHGGNHSKHNAKLALYYVLGMALSYTIAGMLAGYLGSSLQSFLQIPSVIFGFSLLLLLMGLAMQDVIQLRLPHWISQLLPQNNPQKTTKSAFSIFMMGAISVLVVSPCVTAPLIGILTFISQSGEVLQGGIVLFVMALGMGVPLIIFAAGQGALLPKAGQWMLLVKQFFAYMMYGMAIWLASRALSPVATQYLTFGLFIAFALHMGSLIKQFQQTLVKVGLSTLTILTGTLLLPSMVYQPIQADPQVSRASKVEFQHLNTLNSVADALNTAAQAHQPAFVVFHATWCSDCVAMDQQVFSDPAISKALSKFKKIKVDISDKTATTLAFKKQYHVLGTPMLLFYNSKGELLPKLSAAGIVKKPDLLALIHQVQ